VSMLVWDYDNGTSFSEAIAPWRGYRWLAYSSYSNTAEMDGEGVTKFRIVIPLAEDVPAHHWAEFRATAKARAAGVVDDTDDLARMYLLPRKVGDRTAWTATSEPDAPLLHPAEFDQVDELESEPEAEEVNLDETLLASFLDEAIERMRRRGRGEEKPIPLPWAGLSEKLGGGFWPGQQYVLVGNTGSGKSQFSIQLAYESARMKVPVLYVGLELGRQDLAARLLALAYEQNRQDGPAYLNWSNIYLGQHADSREFSQDGRERPAIERAIEGGARSFLKGLPLHLEISPPYGWHYDRLHALGKQMRERYPEHTDDNGDPIPGSRPFLVVLDYLQVVSSSDPKQSIRERIAGASYAGRAVAQDLNAAVLLISSTSRENYSRLSKYEPWKTRARGLVGIGKESGEVEFSADGLLAMNNVPWMHGQCPEGGSFVYVGVAKQRAGAGGRQWHPMQYNGNTFTEPPENAVESFQAEIADYLIEIEAEGKIEKGRVDALVQAAKDRLKRGKSKNTPGDR